MDCCKTLKAREHSGLIRVFSDETIHPSDRWDPMIQDALQRADVAVLLVSRGFLASPYIRKIELPTILERAREGTLRVLSVLIEPCDYQAVPGLGEFQFVNDPKRPVAGLDPLDQKEVWVKINHHILGSADEQAT